MGQSPSSNTYNLEKRGYPFYQGNSDFGKLHPHARIWCDQPKKMARKNDILVSVRAPIGELNIANEDCCIGRGLAAITINKSKSNLMYVFYALTAYNKVLKEKGTGSTFKAINKSALEEILLPEYDKRKQEEIGQILHYVDDLIDKIKQEINLYDVLVKSRFVELIGDPQTNPFNWEQVKVNDVCKAVVRGPFGSALRKEFFVPPSTTTYKVYEQKNAIQKSSIIGTYYVTEEKYRELRRFECRAGDILMSCSGTMGELYQLPEGCERGIINQALCKFTLNKRILPIVFLVYMKENISSLETKGSGIKNVAAVSYIKSMTINLPPMYIQNQFADFVQQVDKSKYDGRRSFLFMEEVYNLL